MYIIKETQIFPNDFRKCLFEKVRNSDFSPVLLHGTEYPSNEECTIEINFITLDGNNSIKIHIVGANGIYKSITINIDWKNEFILLSTFESINFTVFHTICSVDEECDNNDDEPKAVNIFKLPTKEIAISIGENDGIIQSPIYTAKEIVDAFNILQKRAIAIGFPIVFDTFTIKTPLELYYHEDYDCVLVDKSVIRDAKANLTEDDIAKLKEYEDNLKWYNQKFEQQ